MKLTTEMCRECGREIVHNHDLFRPFDALGLFDGFIVLTNIGVFVARVINMDIKDVMAAFTATFSNQLSKMHRIRVMSKHDFMALTNEGRMKVMNWLKQEPKQKEKPKEKKKKEKPKEKSVWVSPSKQKLDSKESVAAFNEAHKSVSDVIKNHAPTKKKKAAPTPVQKTRAHFELLDQKKRDRIRKQLMDE